MEDQVMDFEGGEYSDSEGEFQESPQVDSDNSNRNSELRIKKALAQRDNATEKFNTLNQTVSLLNEKLARLETGLTQPQEPELDLDSLPESERVIYQKTKGLESQVQELMSKIENFTKAQQEKEETGEVESILKGYNVDKADFIEETKDFLRDNKDIALAYHKGHISLSRIWQLYKGKPINARELFPAGNTNGGLRSQNINRQKQFENVANELNGLRDDPDYLKKRRQSVDALLSVLAGDYTS
jgi:hypothetical protein